MQSLSLDSTNMTNEFKYYNHLGFFNPYFVTHNEKNLIFSNIKEALKFLPEDLVIDPVAIIELLNKNYILGDRTMIKGIQKSPWMARPNETQTDWKFFEDLPPHEEKKVEPEEVAVKLHDLLLSELREYIGTKKSIGILLSGGMDSRIVAGLLQEIKMESANESNFDVIALTWGLPSSRDVVYAAKIAKGYNWEWKHFEVGVEQMEENIRVSAEYGCEYSPIHLHAMPQIRHTTGLDCIVAGSFGDSIGRGEYSGNKVKNLTEFSKTAFNRKIAGIVRTDCNEEWNEGIRQDVQAYHHTFPRQKGYQQAELDHQLHYMRRMLNPCMYVIHQKIPLFQLFTSPSVFGYMWSLHPASRNDHVYSEMIKKYFPELLKVPWARSGIKYPNREGQPDSFSKKNHEYEQLIREHFLQGLKKDEVKHHLARLNVFHMSTVERLVKLCESFPIPSSRYFEEKLLWMLSLSTFAKNYNIHSHLSPVTSFQPMTLATDYGKRYIKQKTMKYFKPLVRRLS